MKIGYKLGYARVSTDAQETHLQLDALQRAKCSRIYQEKASGAKAERPELMRLLDNARKGDVVIVWKLDRLARSLRQLIDTMALFHERGVARLPVTRDGKLIGILTRTDVLRAMAARLQAEAGVENPSD